MKIDVFNMNAKKVGEMELKDEVFGREYNEALIHQVVVAQLSNKRQGTKSTLTRSEVRGGGIKPWRQKGTGRARQGSIRSPQWTGGGVVFAPKPRDFSQKVNKKMKYAAFAGALSAKVSAGEMVVLDKLELSEAKTKIAAAMLKSFDKKAKSVIVIKTEGNEDNAAKVLRAFANIPGVSVVDAQLLSVYELVANTNLFITSEAVEFLQEEEA